MALPNVGPTVFAWGRAGPCFAFTLHEGVVLLLTKLNEPKQDKLNKLLKVHPAEGPSLQDASGCVEHPECQF